MKVNLKSVSLKQKLFQILHFLNKGKAVFLLKLTRTIVAQKQSKVDLYFKNTFHTWDHLANCPLVFS